MKRISIFILIILVISFLSMKTVSAYANIQNECLDDKSCMLLCNYNFKNMQEISNSASMGCDALFGNPDDPDANEPAYWIQWSLDIIKYIAIIAVFGLSTVDFIKAITSQDQDAIQKAGITAVKRFAFAVLMFFLPIIVEFLMTLFGAYGTCGFE